MCVCVCVCVCYRYHQAGMCVLCVRALHLHVPATATRVTCVCWRRSTTVCLRGVVWVWLTIATSTSSLYWCGDQRYTAPASMPVLYGPMWVSSRCVYLPSCSIQGLSYTRLVLSPYLWLSVYVCVCIIKKLHYFCYHKLVIYTVCMILAYTHTRTRTHTHKYIYSVTPFVYLWTYSHQYSWNM